MKKEQKPYTVVRVKDNVLDVRETARQPVVYGTTNPPRQIEELPPNLLYGSQSYFESLGPLQAVPWPVHVQDLNSWATKQDPIGLPWQNNTTHFCPPFGELAFASEEHSFIVFIFTHDIIKSIVPEIDLSRPFHLGGSDPFSLT